MAIKSEHIAGFVAGIGAATVGLYLYKQNQNRVDQWLRQQGINVPQGGRQNESTMSVDDLMLEKERLEDLIAEREMQDKEKPAVAPAS